MRKNLIPLLFAGLVCLGGVAQVQADEAASVAAVQVQSAKVNINTADADTLARELKGIGPAKAMAIVDYRTEQGDFVSVDELLEVKGIGVATLEKIRHQLSID